MSTSFVRGTVVVTILAHDQYCTWTDLLPCQIESQRARYSSHVSAYALRDGSSLVQGVVQDTAAVVVQQCPVLLSAAVVHQPQGVGVLLLVSCNTTHRKRWLIARNAMQVATQAIAHMPSLLLFPLVPFLLEVALVFWWVYVAAYLYSSGMLHIHHNSLYCHVCSQDGNQVSECGAYSAMLCAMAVSSCVAVKV